MRSFYVTIVLFTFLFSTTGCFRKFYDTSSTTVIGDKEWELLKDPNRNVILHFDEMPMRATHVAIKDSVLTAELRYMQGAPGTDITPSFEVGSHAFKKGHKEMIEAQVHVFLQEQEKPASNRLSIPLKKVDHIQTYSYNKRKSNTSTILSAVGIAAAAVGSIFIVTGAIYGLIDAIFLL